MKLILKRSWEVFDFSKKISDASGLKHIGPGEYEVVRIDHPHGLTKPNKTPVKCVVLKGTRIGATEGFWRLWASDQADTQGEPINPEVPEVKEFEVVIEEDDAPPQAACSLQR